MNKVLITTLIIMTSISAHAYDYGGANSAANSAYNNSMSNDDYGRAYIRQGNKVIRPSDDAVFQPWGGTRTMRQTQPGRYDNNNIGSWDY